MVTGGAALEGETGGAALEGETGMVTGAATLEGETGMVTGAALSSVFRVLKCYLLLPTQETLWIN